MIIDIDAIDLDALIDLYDKEEKAKQNRINAFSPMRYFADYFAAKEKNDYRASSEAAYNLKLRLLNIGFDLQYETEDEEQVYFLVRDEPYSVTTIYGQGSETFIEKLTNNAIVQHNLFVDLELTHYEKTAAA